MSFFELFAAPAQLVVLLLSLTPPDAQAAGDMRSADPPMPIELGRVEMEEKLAQLLDRWNVAFPPKDPAEAREAARKQAIPTYAFYSDIGAGGVLLSVQEITFENCVLVERLKRPNRTSGRLEMIRETRRHVALLDTDPRRLEIEPWMRSSPGREVTVTIPFRQDMRKRMDMLNEAAGKILDEAYRRYPEDVAGRLRWLKAQYEEELRDKIYRYASGIDYHSEGVAVTAPLSTDNWFKLHRMRAEEFIYLIDAYRRRHCATDPTIGR